MIEPPAKYVAAWRLAAVTGVVALIGSSAWKLEPMFTWVVAVVPVAAAVVSGLLGSTATGEDGTNWFVANLRRAFSRKAYLKALTFATWTISAFIVGFSIYAGSRRGAVRGIVRTPEGDPAVEARLRVVGSPGVVQVDTSGAFRLPPIRGVKPGDTIWVSVDWHGSDSLVAVIVPMNSDIPRVVQLRWVEAPFRARFYQPDPDVLFNLTQHGADEYWQSSDETHPPPVDRSHTYNVLNTSTFAALESFPNGSATIFIDFDTTTFRQYVEDGFRTNKWIAGAFNVDTSRGKVLVSARLFRVLSATEVRTLLDSRARKVSSITDDPESRRQLLQQINVDREALQFYGSRIPDAYVMEVSENMECGEDGLYTDIVIHAPRILVRTAFIDNANNTRMTVGPFQVRMSLTRELRTIRTDVAELLRAPSEQANLFPFAALPANEMLVVPLAITLQRDRSLIKEIESLSASRRLSLRELLSLPPSDSVILNFTFGTKNVAINVSHRALIDAATHPLPQPPEGRVIGPSIHLDQMEVNGRRFPMRDPGSYAMVWRGGGLGASCPVLSVTGSDGNIVRIGEVMAGNRQRLNEGTSEIRLASAPLRLRISEEEREITFLDQIEIIGTDARGRQMTVTSSHPKLRTRDHNYLEIHQGERIVIILPKGTRRFVGPIVVRFSGFFVPIT